MEPYVLLVLTSNFGRRTFWSWKFKKKFRDIDRFFGTRRTRKNRSRSPKTTLSGRTFGIVFFGDPKNDQKHYEKYNVFVRFCSVLKVQLLIFDHLELFLGLGTCFFEFYGFQRIDPCPVTFFFDSVSTLVKSEKFHLTHNNKGSAIWFHLYVDGALQATPPQFQGQTDFSGCVFLKM